MTDSQKRDPGNLDIVEAAVFAEAGNGIDTGIFILGSPRSGSTILYQLMASVFRLPFISNLTNEHFAANPIVGIALQHALPPWSRIGFKSEFGKTKEPHEPHEGSAVLSRWFGGGHPSQLVSATIKEGQELHMRATLAAVHGMFGRPLLIKNAWNCFRVRYLATAFPRAQFIWIRRDISEASRSDLRARYVTKGSPEEWNSATPANVDALRTLPYTAQVIENQYEFNEAIGKDLAAHASGRFAEVWYDRMCVSPRETLRDLAAKLDLPVRDAMELPSGLQFEPGVSGASLPAADNLSIDEYLGAHARRFAAHQRM